MRFDDSTASDWLPIPDDVIRTFHACSDYLAGIGVPTAHFRKDELQDAVRVLADLADAVPAVSESKRELAHQVVYYADLVGLVDPLGPEEAA